MAIGIRHDLEDETVPGAFELSFDLGPLELGATQSGGEGVRLVDESGGAVVDESGGGVIDD